MRIPSIYPAIALVACGLAAPTAMARAPETCLAPAERERLLALDKDTFDQDLRSGWRMLAICPAARRWPPT